MWWFMTLAEKILKRMEERGHSQIWLASRVGTSATQVGRWLDLKKDQRGSRPSYRELLMLARVLELPLEYLCDDSCDDPAQYSGPQLNADERRIVELARIIGYELATKRLMALPESAPPKEP